MLSRLPCALARAISSPHRAGNGVAWQARTSSSSACGTHPCRPSLHSSSTSSGRARFERQLVGGLVARELRQLAGAIAVQAAVADVKHGARHHPRQDLEARQRTSHAGAVGPAMLAVFRIQRSVDRRGIRVAGRASRTGCRRRSPRSSTPTSWRSSSAVFSMENQY